MKFSHALFLTTLILLAACNANIAGKAEQISYTVTYGMCQGYCSTTVAVTPNTITTTRSSYLQEDKFPTITDSKRITNNEWQEFLKVYDWKKIQAMDSVYGCPGCADGGIATLTISTKNNFKTTRFEEENPPAAIQPLINLIRESRSNLAVTSPNNSTQAPAMVKNDFTNQPATIKNFVCSRGCYQFVIETSLQGKKLRLYDPNLADDFKKDGLSIVFSGAYTGGKTEIKKPAPNDIPVRDFDAVNISIKEIKAKD